MKKLILILLLAGIVAFGGVSVWGSLRAKQAYRAMILAIAEHPETRVLEAHYERGWLQSKAEASVEIRGLLGESFRRGMVGLGRDEVRGRVGVRMRQTIEHGYTPLMEWLTSGMEGTPIVARVETHLELDNETQSEFAAVAGRMPPVWISTLIRISGIAESSVTVPTQSLESELTGEAGGVWAARWEGLTGKVVYTTGFEHFVASFHSPGIEGSSAGSIFALRDLRWTADLARDESGLLVGDTSTSVEFFQLSSREEGAPRLELDHWAMSQSNALENGNLESAWQVRVQAIRLGEQAFGPGSFDLRLRNLDARSLARLQSQGMDGLAPTEASDVAQPAVDGGARDLLPAFLSRSPQLEVSALHLKTPAGDIGARLRIDLDSGDSRQLHDLRALPLALRAEAELECPAEILNGLYREREEELLALLREGWIVQEGERYRSRLEFERGELVVNGIPKALGDLPGRPAEPSAIPQISANDSGPEGVAPGSEPLP